jgi:iron complex outermembrane receptor protein
MSGERARDGDYALGDLDAIRARPHHVSHDFEGLTDRDIIAPTLLVTHHGTALDLEMISGGVHWNTADTTDLDYSPVPAARRSNKEEEWQVTEELRVASAKDAPIAVNNDLKLKWQAGVFFFNQAYRQNAINSFAPFVVSPLIDFPVSERAPHAQLDDTGAGAYAQTTLTAWDKVDLMLGLRGDYESKNADLTTSFTPPVAPAVKTEPNRGFWAGSPQVGVDYRWPPHAMIYATANRGYKAGGFNPIAPPDSTSYGQETSWNYEVGAKTTWFDSRLSLNADFFYIRWNDLQLNQPTGSPGQFFIANAGNADSKGVEVEINARPLAGWDIFTGIGTADARFRHGATAGHTDASGADSTVDVAGRHLIYAPDVTAHAGSQYAWHLCPQATLYTRAEVLVFGHYYYNAANTAGQTSYVLANFRVGLRGPHWLAEGWIENAFDQHYIPIAFEFPNGQSGLVGESGAPLTFGLRAGLSF